MDIHDLIRKAQDKEYIRVDMHTERDVNNFVEFCNKKGIRWLNGKKPKHGETTTQGGVKVGISLFMNVEYLEDKDFNCITFSNIDLIDKESTLIPSESLLCYKNIKRGLL